MRPRGFLQRLLLAAVTALVFSSGSADGKNRIEELAASFGWYKSLSAETSEGAELSVHFITKSWFMFGPVLGVGSHNNYLEGQVIVPFPAKGKWQNLRSATAAGVARTKKTPESPEHVPQVTVAAFVFPVPVFPYMRYRPGSDERPRAFEAGIMAKLAITSARLF